MSRMLLIGLLGLPAIAGSVGIYRLVSADPAEVTLEIDVFDFREQWLEGTECNHRGAPYVVLKDDFEVFYLRSALDSPIRQNVYSRPKASHVSGVTISIVHAPLNTAANRPESSAWMSSKPCKFTVTPTVRHWNSDVRLAIEFDPTDCKRSEIDVVVPAERALLVFLEDEAPGIHRVVLIQPRIVKADRGGWFN